MAADWIPTVMARGFHAGPVFSIFGAAIAAAKIMRFTEDQVHAVISLCTNLAGSNLESRALREGAAVRNAMLAVALAKQGKSAAARRCSKVRRASITPTPATTRASSPTASPATTAHQSRQAHRRSRQGVDAPRDALPDLLDSRLQHRAHRRHGEALRRAQHPISGRRSRRGGRELARDAVSEPRLSARSAKTSASRGAAARAITRRTASSSAASRCWPARPIRRKCSS